MAPFLYRLQRFEAGTQGMAGFYIIYISLTTNRQIAQDRTSSHNWNEADEQEFTALLEKELDKIHDFQKFKVTLCQISNEFYLHTH